MSDDLPREKPSASHQFLERFKGKTNKVSKLGINAVLLQQSPENMEVELIGPSHHMQDIPTPKRTYSKNNTPLRPLPKAEEIRSKSVEKSLIKSKPISCELKRNPSQKLPSLYSSKELPSSKPMQRRGSLESTLEKKLLGTGGSIERKTSKNGSKYSQWKCPTKLN